MDSWDSFVLSKIFNGVDSRYAKLTKTLFQNCHYSIPAKDLAKMIGQVMANRKPPEKIAKEYCQRK